MWQVPKVISGLKLSEYEKFVTTAPSRITNLDELFKLGMFPRDRWNAHKVDSDHAIFPWIGKNEDKRIQPGDWTYHINKYNFRDPWNLASTKPKVGFFGCSFTFGEGIKSEETFVQLAAKECNLEPFNFGVGGSSVHRIARTFSAVTNLIDLDYAVFTLPHWHRQLYIDKDGKAINLIPGWPHEDYKKLNDKLTELDEEYYVVQAASFVTWIYDVAKLRNIKLILSAWDHPLNDLCRVMYPNNSILPFPNIDDKRARDKLHPGPLSHNSHAQQIIRKINDKTWV
jgi:hypothetical protein